MILLTRLNGPQTLINADLIERAESNPDTVITLVDGTKYVVVEGIDEIIERVRQFRASILVAARALELDEDLPQAPVLRMLPQPSSEG